MAINNAMKFIRESQVDPELRKVVNKTPGNELIQQLTELGYEFDVEEFEESVNMMHVKCQFEEEANRLMQTAMWFRMSLNQ
ncbi:Nif11-like leader peptide family natural product precursor [uncultured Sunxiuqinia sp.]|uniref:Nif11-like leader peptide family natural product precursor n=1 Tax=uncultured Sunxiuqinia sp. TaxID=1573825 RepID=UPI002AA65CD3|nr:Nif11-like leader peptide family natural product precursor [uncultured Sunxiuqinia sp.]